MDQSEIPDHGNRFVSQLYDGFLNISIILICSSLMLPVSSSSMIWGFCGSRITSTGAFFMLKIQLKSSDFWSTIDLTIPENMERLVV